MEHATRRAILNSPLYLMEFKHLGVIGLLKDVLVTRNIDLEYGQEPSRLLCSLVRLYMLRPDRSIVHEILSARALHMQQPSQPFTSAATGPLWTFTRL